MLKFFLMTRGLVSRLGHRANQLSAFPAGFHPVGLAILSGPLAQV